MSKPVPTYCHPDSFELTDAQIMEASQNDCAGDEGTAKRL